MRAVCQNKWCKAPFEKAEVDDQNTICPKCKSMANEVSGGVGGDGLPSLAYRDWETDRKSVV